MLQLLGRPTSINVRKVLWTLEELGLAFEHQPEWAGERSAREPAFLALNPNGLVPVLRDGELVLWQSNTICRYLAGRERRVDLLPAEPAPRALVERWMDWQATELNGAWRHAFMALVRRDPRFTDAAQVAASTAAWNAQMAVLEAHLAQTGAFVAGNGFTLADIVLAVSVHRWNSTPMEKPPLQAVAAWMRRLEGRAGHARCCGPGTP